MGFGSFLKKVTLAPTKLLTKPVQKTLSSSKKLFGGNVRGAFNELNLARPGNIKEGFADFRGMATPWRDTGGPLTKGLRGMLQPESAAPPPMAGGPPPMAGPAPIAAPEVDRARKMAQMRQMFGQ